MRHYTEWMNSLTDADLMTYAYREVLIIQPTWMMRRITYDAVGGYAERGTDAAPFPEVASDWLNHFRTSISIIGFWTVAVS